METSASSGPYAWVPLAMFALTFVTSVAGISFLWGTFRADMRSIREWVSSHERESASRDEMLRRHLELLTRLETQVKEREKRDDDDRRRRRGGG
jgi:hypothetical protein